MRTILAILLLLFPISAYQAEINPDIENLGLWCVYIETEGGEEPVCDVIRSPSGCWGKGITNMNKVPCRVFIRSGGGILYDSDDYNEGVSGATIRVRGNSSASLWEKKPYKIRLQKKADLLCREDDVFKDKDWLLLKDSGINSLIGFKINEMLGLPYSPQFRYVNVILNGNWKGTYLLGESVKRNNLCRIDVEDSGYIFEYDAYWWNEEMYVKSSFPEPMHYTFKYPDEDDLSPERLNEFAGFIQTVEKSIREEDYVNYIDLDSFVLWILGQDIIGNHDFRGSNIFLYMKSFGYGDKMKTACLWDFDGIMAVDGFAPIHGYFYFRYLFRKNAFKKLFISAYDKYSHKTFRDIKYFIRDFAKSEYGKSYSRSYEKDRKLWEDYDSTYVSFEERIQNSLEWFDKREPKLNSLVNNMRQTTSILSPDILSTRQNDEYYYDLMGRKSNNPPKGINIKDGKKIIIKN